MDYCQALGFRRFQRGFHRFNLHSLTNESASFAMVKGRKLKLKAKLENI
jgi:hypothetical protein